VPIYSRGRRKHAVASSYREKFPCFNLKMKEEEGMEGNEKKRKGKLNASMTQGRRP
jgi:hypothetical protein